MKEMTLDEAREIIKNATPITPIRRSATINLNDKKQENNSFKDIMKRWQQKK